MKDECCSRAISAFHCCINFAAQSEYLPSSFSKVTVSLALWQGGSQSSVTGVTVSSLSEYSFILGDSDTSSLLNKQLSVHSERCPCNKGASANLRAQIFEDIDSKEKL